MTLNDIKALARTDNIELIDKALDVYLTCRKSTIAEHRLTALVRYTACRCGNLKLVKHLVAKSVLFSRSDMIVASGKGHGEVVEYLKTLTLNSDL